MLNLFKTKIPKDNVTEVTVVKTWTVQWYSFHHDFGNYGTKKHNVKVFVNEDEKTEFVKQLREAAKFVNTDIVNLTVNEN